MSSEPDVKTEFDFSKYNEEFQQDEAQQTEFISLWSQLFESLNYEGTDKFSTHEHMEYLINLDYLRDTAADLDSIGFDHNTTVHMELLSKIINIKYNNLDEFRYQLHDDLFYRNEKKIDDEFLTANLASILLNYHSPQKLFTTFETLLGIQLSFEHVEATLNAFYITLWYADEPWYKEIEKARSDDYPFSPHCDASAEELKEQLLYTKQQLEEQKRITRETQRDLNQVLTTTKQELTATKNVLNQILDLLSQQHNTVDPTALQQQSKHIQDLLSQLDTK